MVNVMNQLGMKEARVNVRVKTIYSKPRGNSVLSGENFTAFPWRSGKGKTTNAAWIQGKEKLNNTLVEM